MVRFYCSVCFDDNNPMHSVGGDEVKPEVIDWFRTNGYD